MNQAAVTQNENALSQFIDQSDKKHVTQTAMMSLALLAERLSPEGYKAFLEECSENAFAMHKYKMLNSGKVE